MKNKKIIDMLAVESDDENIEETTKVEENEIVIYAKVGKSEGLQEANSVEQHTELCSRFITGNRTRVRKIENKSSEEPEVSFIYTFKVSNNDDAEDDVHSNSEYNAVVDSDFFEGFRNVAEKLISKVRYNFDSKTVKLAIGSGEDKEIIEIPDVKYEVDIYQDSEGKDFEWCKIDIEVDTILDYLAANKPEIKDVNLNISISHLEFEPTDAIIDIDASDEDRAVIDDLWEKWSQPPLKSD